MEHDNLSTTQIRGWLERLRAGDASARDELLAHCSERLERLTRKMLRRFPALKPWEETGDVYQGAVMRLLRSLGKLDVTSVRHFFRLATTHIRRELIDLHRHYYGPHGIGTHQPPDLPGATNNSVPSPLEVGCTTDDGGKLAEWADLHRKAAELPDDEREVFDLLWYQELTQAEAAKLLDVSERTVLRRWMAARLRLRQYLQEE